MLYLFTGVCILLVIVSGIDLILTIIKRKHTKKYNKLKFLDQVKKGYFD